MFPVQLQRLFMKFLETKTSENCNSELMQAVQSQESALSAECEAEISGVRPPSHPSSLVLSRPDLFLTDTKKRTLAPAAPQAIWAAPAEAAAGRAP